MNKAAKIFVYASLLYGAAMFMVIVFYHADEWIQEKTEIKPSSEFLTLQENPENTQVPTETVPTNEQPEMDNIYDFRGQPEIIAIEESELIQGESSEEVTDIPNQTIEDNAIPSDEIFEDDTVTPKETIEETTDAPDSTGDNTDDESTLDKIRKVTSIHKETIEHEDPKEAKENTKKDEDEDNDEKITKKSAKKNDNEDEDDEEKSTKKNAKKNVKKEEEDEDDNEKSTKKNTKKKVDEEDLETNTKKNAKKVEEEEDEDGTDDENDDEAETDDSDTPLEDDSAPPKMEFEPFSFNYNPFDVLGAYPDPTPYLAEINYDVPHFGLINNDNYCNEVDAFNLEHPEHMFEQMHFYTDFPKRTVMRKHVMRKLGTMYNIDQTRKMSKKRQKTRQYEFDTRITTLHITGDLYYHFHEIGKHFVCATQMFSHIPNHTDLLQKDHFPQSFANYKLQYEDRPQCYKNQIRFPETFRLFDQNECEDFFEILHSKKYRHSRQEVPIQYILKIGHDAHKAEGVFLVDDHTTGVLNKWFDHGENCGGVVNYLIVQKYITNPMLLDNNNKFHMRVYVLIASTNPLIVYYHDGYLRASIFPFEKGSDNRATHLTNLLMGDKFADAVKTNISNNETQGMTAKELEDYYLWSFEDLGSYLYESKKTKDPNWLDNYLRPSLKKAFVHVVRMTSGGFWKQSNVYEMLGCDFILDADMKLWFIEANANPLLDGVQKEMIIKMLRDLFEIEYALFRSRMKRVFDVLSRMPQDAKEAGDGLEKKSKGWRQMYQEALKNRVEPEYKIKETNSWKMIMNMNLEGAEAYFGHIPEECL